MKMLNVKLLREVKASGGLLAAIALIMAIGVSCFLALNTAHRNLSGALVEYYDQCRMADFSLDVKKAPNSVLPELGKIPGVRGIRARIQSLVTIDLENRPEPLNGLVASLPDARQRVINDIYLVRGGYFTDRRAEEVLVNDAFAVRHNLHPGMWIHVILNNRRQPLFIVGTAKSAEFAYVVGPGGLIPDPERFGVLYLKHSYMEETFGFTGAFNQIVGLLEGTAKDQPTDVLDRAERVLESYGVLTTVPRKDQPSHRFISNEIRQLGTMSVMLPGIFLSVAGLVLNMLLIRLIDQQRTTIGTLKALGCSDFQVLVHYMQLGMVVGLVGGAAGVFAGSWMAAGMTVLYRYFFEFPALESKMYWDLAAAGMGISLACSAAGALQGARTVLKLEAAEAMRPRPPVQGGAVWIERIGFLWKRLDSGWRMTLRNLARNRFRTAAGAFAAAMGTALVVNVLLLNQSIRFLVDFQFEKVVRSDFDLAFKDERSYDAFLEARRLPGVDWAEPSFAVACDFTHGHRRKRSAISGVAPHATLTVPRDTRLDPVRVPSAGLLMGDALAEILDVKPGDYIVVRPIKGDRRVRTAQVVAVAEGYMGLTCYADTRYLAKLVGEESAVSGVQVMVDPSEASRAAFMKELKRLPSLESFQERKHLIRNFTDTLIKTNTTAVGILLMFSGVIFFGSTLNSALIGLAERSREVGTFLGLGYTPIQVGNLFLREALVVNVFGTLCGLPLGYGLFRMTAAVFSNELARLPLLTPPWVFIATVCVGILFTLIAHGILQWKLFYFDTEETLRTRE